MRRVALVFLSGLLAAPGLIFGKMTPAQVAALPPPANRPIDFAADIRPILESSCIKCHGRGRVKGGFAIDSRETLLRGGDSGAAVVPGQSGQSYLIELVAGVDPDNVMPKKGSKISPEQLSLLRAWIDQGAKWDAEVSFARLEPRNLKPRMPVLPPSAQKFSDPVDAFVDVYFRTHRGRWARPVDDAVYARRVFLDVIGLLPTPAELAGFVSDRAPDKRERLVQSLLARPDDYAQHWLTFWNDLLRNDYRGTGYIDGGRKQITPWLYPALATNMSYDRFVSQLIHPGTNSEGFVRGIVWRGVVNASQTAPMQAAQNISQVFMGVNLKCASCHDSFINDWQLSDAYGLANIYSGEPLEMFQCDKPTGKKAPLKFIYSELGEIPASATREERLEGLARMMTSRADGRLPRTLVNRLWARFMGRGLVEPLDDMEQKAWNEDLLDWLAEDLVAHGYDVKQTIARIVSSKAYQMPSVSATEGPAALDKFTGPQVRRMSAEQFRDALGEVTGVWYAKPAAAVRVPANQVRASLVASDPLMTALGRPNREQVMTSRTTAATTLQALELTNGGTLSALLKSGAAKIAEEGSDPAAVVETVYLRALGRKPSAAEKKEAKNLVGLPVQKEGVEDLLWAISASPEFQLIY